MDVLSSIKAKMFKKGKAKKMGLVVNALHYAVITVAVVIVFHLMGIHTFHTPWTNAVILFAVIAVVDVLFHSLTGYD